METLKYTVIKDKEQYLRYCNLLEDFARGGDPSFEDDIELLEVLIDKWDADHDIFDQYDPIELLQNLMSENKLKQAELAAKIGISESYLSEILSYKKEISKKIVRKLAELFSIRQEVFNRPYALKKPLFKEPQPYPSIDEIVSGSSLLVAEPDGLSNYGNQLSPDKKLVVKPEPTASIKPRKKKGSQKS